MKKILITTTLILLSISFSASSRANETDFCVFLADYVSRAQLHFNEMNKTDIDSICTGFKSVEECKNAITTELEISRIDLENAKVLYKKEDCI